MLAGEGGAGGDEIGGRALEDDPAAVVAGVGAEVDANPVSVFPCADRGVVREQSMQRCVLHRAAVLLLPLWSLHGGAMGPMFARTLTEMPALSSNSLHIPVDGATHERAWSLSVNTPWWWSMLSAGFSRLRAPAACWRNQWRCH